MKRTDAMVELNDVLIAIEEIRRGEGPAIMQRLAEVEPVLAIYIEGVSSSLASTALWPRGSQIGMDRTLEAVLTVVRARELANARLFKKLIPPTSPLGRLMEESKTSEKGQK
jgi:hypothetical protein